MMLLKSRYVAPVNQPVIDNGAVLIQDGCIAAVGSARELDAVQVVDYGDAVICPGFVNAHTHLELSLLAGKVVPTRDFVDWLRRLLAALEASPETPEHVQRAVRLGVAQSIRSGVTTAGDITRWPEWTREALAGSPVRAVSFGEVIAIGTGRDKLDRRLAAAASPTHQALRLRIGISPHSPYTVEPGAMRACADRARKIGAPTCIHLAETADEEPFTRWRQGPLVDHLRNLGVWDDAIPVAGCGPVDLALTTGLLNQNSLVAHANYVTDNDIDRLATSGTTVAFCPRTHHAFGHPPHRFRDMLAVGINVCVGTDSLASNPSLSVLDELRFLHREYPSVAAAVLLALGTLHGAGALGFEDVVGSLTVGKSADIAVVPLSGTHQAQRWDRIFDSTEQPLAVYVSGVLQPDQSSRMAD